MPEHDAVVIGAGHNGLAAAVVLAEAGWDVVVLERADEPGGAVQTAEVTLPGFRHDLMATNLNLFAGSPFVAEYGERLARHGLEFVAASRPACSVFPDGRYVGISTTLEETLDSIRSVSPADAEAYARLFERFGEVAPHLFPLLGVEMPSVAAVRRLWSGRRSLGSSWPFELARLVLQSTRELVGEHFESPEVQALAAAWGMHLDFPPDAPGGALFPFLETMAGQANGMALGKGGARVMIDALTGLLEELGGEVRCGVEVDQVLVQGGKAVGVLAGGERYLARKAVVASLTPTVLFGRLVEPAELPGEFLEKVDGFRYAPGTLMIHLALEGLPTWTASPLAREHAYVHIGPYLEDMSLAYHHAVSGLLPSRPMLVVGQPTAVDPTRAPEGRHVLWVQVRMVPGRINGDAAGEIDAVEWAEAREPMADRVMGILEEYAPGLGSKVLARHVMSPADLEEANPNLVGGDQLSGSHRPMQNFFLRPFPGWSRYTTPIDHLYMCGAATWPGAGVGAGSGFLLGRRLVGRRRRG